MKTAKPARDAEPGGKTNSAKRAADGAKAAKSAKRTNAAKSPKTANRARPGAARKKAGAATAGGAANQSANSAQAGGTAKPAAAKQKRALGASLPKGYRPQASETFMSPRQKEYFRRKLLSWREEILAESRETILHLQEHSPQEPDIADRASIEAERLIELRTRDRERKLLSKIDAALMRIDDGSYGFCEETGEPISLKRLEARPIATLSLDAQERHERLEKTYRDD